MNANTDLARLGLLHLLVGEVRRAFVNVGRDIDDRPRILAFPGGFMEVCRGRIARQTARCDGPGDFFASVSMVISALPEPLLSVGGTSDLACRSASHFTLSERASSESHVAAATSTMEGASTRATEKITITFSWLNT
jgi:hypothetical protein